MSLYTCLIHELPPLLAGELHFTDYETSHTDRVSECEQILLVFLL